MLVKPEQPAKAKTFIDVTPSGMVISVRFLQFIKALVILFMPFGMFISIIFSLSIPP